MTLQEIIDDSSNIVFSEEREYLQKAVFLIFARWTVFIIRNMIIRLRKYYHTLSLKSTRIIFINFTVIKCFAWTHSQMLPI